MKKSLLSKLTYRHGWLKGLQFILLLAMLIGSFTVTKAQVTLVKDISPNNGNDTYPDQFNYLTVHQGNLYFSFYNNEGIYELWKSDGTKGGTVLIKKFYHLTSLVSSGNYIYFVAETEESANGGEGDVIYGWELWRSDGTVEGTIMVKDIFPGEQSSNPLYLTDVNGTLFFRANNGVNGVELWKSNGTSAGTVLVKDIVRVVGNSNPQNLVAMNGQLYFKASNAVNGYELWRSDGTEAGTVLVADINPGVKVGSNPEQIVNANGTLFFFANDGTNGKQLWKSNGEVGNATLVKIIRAGGTSGLDLLTKVNDNVFFQANDGVHGNELWTSNGTTEGTYLVEDITPGPGSASGYATPHLRDLRESNGKLYFLGVARDYQDLWVSDGTAQGTYSLTYQNNVGFAWTDHGATPYNGLTYFAGMSNDESSYLELWRTDGTVAGTMMVHANIGDGFYNNMMTQQMNGKLYFIGKSELWESDGTPDGTKIVRVFGSVMSSYAQDLTDVNGELFFKATDNNYYYSLWKTNGTEAGTVKLNPSLRQANHITNINGTVFFAGKDHRGEELWKSDGTPEGTVLVKDFVETPGWYQEGLPHNFIEYNGQAYFSAQTQYHSFDLWRSDGTTEGTQSVHPNEPWETPFGLPEQLTTAGGKLFFTAVSSKGNELHVYDGVNPPVLVKDIKLHYMGSHPIRLTEFKGILYFQADNRGNGYELFRSNGTAAGTYIVKDIRREDLGSGEELAPVDMGNMMATPEALYFSAIKPNGKNSLWRSDGTAAGTRPYFEFAGLPNVEILSVNGNTITVAVGYDTSLELWTSNGTAAGTRKITTISELNNVVIPTVVEMLNGVTYFLAYSSSAYEIWRTDGTEEGTYKIIFDGTPSDLEVSGGKVYMSGRSKEFGWELFIINDDASPAMAARMDEAIEVQPEVTDYVALANYPNPFTTQFSLRVAGEDEQSFLMNVIDSKGTIVDRKQLLYNQDHLVGQSWDNGFYILQVYTGEKMITKKIMKGSGIKKFAGN